MYLAVDTRPKLCQQALQAGPRLFGRGEVVRDIQPQVAVGDKAFALSDVAEV
jgi:hypothetical protein